MRSNRWTKVAVLAAWMAGFVAHAEPVEAEGLTAEAMEALARRGAVVLPRAVPVLGRTTTSWTEDWWHWTFAVPAAQNPELVLDADCGVGQSGPVFFVPAYDGATTYQRTCRVAFGKPVLVPLWVIINDYPCPDPSFEPPPGQSLEQFLREGARGFNDFIQDVVVTVNGQPVPYTRHRHTSPLFTFSADPSLVGQFPDPCLTGTPQPGVSDGWWLMLALAPGEHTVRIQAVAPMGYPIDYTYTLRVER